MAFGGELDIPKASFAVPNPTATAASASPTITSAWGQYGGTERFAPPPLTAKPEGSQLVAGMSTVRRKQTGVAVIA